MSEKSTELKVIPLGGLGEIGMNCMVLEYADEILIVDCGLIFSDLDQFGVAFGIPDFTYILENKDKVRGIFVTHGHEDHIGALSFLIQAGINAPIYASAFSTLLIVERLKEAGVMDQATIRTFTPKDQFEFKRFKVRTIPVNHSIIEASALVIETPIGRVVHTGDFRIEPAPFYGRELEMERFKELGDQGVLLLLSDSTNVERCEHTISEKKVHQMFEQTLAAAEGMVVVSMFASNVARMGQLLQVAAKLGKRVYLSGRSMDQNAHLAMDLGYLKDAPNVLVSTDQLDGVSRSDLLVLATGSQGEYRSSLARLAHGDHPKLELQQGDLVIMSSKFIPGNEKAIGKMINQLFKQGAEVMYDAVHEVHVSGHASRPELKRMIEAVRPKHFIPIHGEYRHLVHHAALAKECGVQSESVVVATNGSVVSVTPDRVQIVEERGENRVLVEGREGGDVTKLVLKERRRMGETGVVFSLLVRNSETREILAGPEIIMKGLVSEEHESQLIEASRKIVRDIANGYEESVAEGKYNEDLQETIRIRLRRYYNEKIGRKPTVLPIVLDL